MKLVKIAGIPLKNLQNEEHYAFMCDVRDMLIAADIAEIADELPALKAAIADEDLALEVIRKSQYTALLKKKDGYRDSIFGGFKLVVEGHLRHPFPHFCEAARLVTMVVAKYKSANTENYQKATAMYENFVEELELNYKPQCTTLVLLDWVAALKQANADFKQLYGERRQENAGRLPIKMPAARAVCDEIYRSVTEKANAFTICAPSDKLTVFISNVNTAIEQWKLTLAQRKGRTSKEKEPDAEYLTVQ